MIYELCFLREMKINLHSLEYSRILSTLVVDSVISINSHTLRVYFISYNEGNIFGVISTYDTFTKIRRAWNASLCILHT